MRTQSNNGRERLRELPHQPQCTDKEAEAVARNSVPGPAGTGAGIRTRAVPQGSVHLTVHTQGPSSTGHKYNPASSRPVFKDLLMTEHLKQDAPVSLTFSQFRMKY